MNTKVKLESNINELDNSFKELISTEKLNINSIETLALNSIEECKKIINCHIEELIMKTIDEKELIIKKNRNGEIKDLN